MVADLLFDAGTMPTHEALRPALGAAAGWWDELVARIEAMGARGSFTWEGPKHGWSLRYTRAGRPFVALSPGDGGFRVLVILGHAQVEEVPTLPLGQHLRAVFDAARQYPDGRWLFIPVTSAADVVDIVTLLATKLPPTIRAKVATIR